jgi:hypothetical protein
LWDFKWKVHNVRAIISKITISIGNKQIVLILIAIVYKDWEDNTILNIVLNPTYENTADMFSMNATENMFHTTGINLLSPITNKREYDLSPLHDITTGFDS